MKFLTKQEVRYILGATVFALVWFLFLMQFLMKALGNSNPMAQFVVFNVGIYMFLFLFLKSISGNNGANLGSSFGLLLLFLALDVMMPEYHVGYNGALIEGATLGISTSDYFFGYLFTSMGVGGFFVFLLTYIIVPPLLLLGSAKLLPNFVKKL